MDCEKKYKEAQKWIESIYSELSHEHQMEAEAVFPELKESEDERIRKRIIHALHGDVLDMEETTKAIAWLEKQGEQKSQRMISAEAKEAMYDKPAWSEEDDKMINKLLAVIKLYYDRDGDDLDRQSCISWLKSLKDRYTWKPSDAQMGALHDLNLTGNISYAGQGQVLIELYNDLKKLTE